MQLCVIIGPIILGQYKNATYIPDCIIVPTSGSDTVYLPYSVIIVAHILFYFKSIESSEIFFTETSDYI